MHLPSLLVERFRNALGLCSFASKLTADQQTQFAAMIRPSGNPEFGDYQANCAMPIAKVAGVNPREVASEIVQHVDIRPWFETPEIAGPGFINLRLRADTLNESLKDMLGDPRCLVESAEPPRKILIDYSSPNVAKPMHVGHIRTTVIGNCLAKTLAFLGHDVVTDNHLGDWGTQFGIIIYGYKHFGDPDVVMSDPVPELAKLYRVVHQIMGYQKAVETLPTLEQNVETLESQYQTATQAAEGLEGKEGKKARKSAGAIQKKLNAAKQAVTSAQATIAATDSDTAMKERADAHPDINTAVLLETSKLHQDDPTNRDLWEKFLPHCKDEINRIYSRLEVEFDHTLGESFYHPMLADVVSGLREKQLATESDGATCIFLDGFDAPMIIQKSDGAFLYATTDLATLQYRESEFAPDEILYVVDARQAEHFDKLFAVADQVGLTNAKLVHVKFGTVLGTDGRPMKTRSGSLIGLESLLDDAVNAARQVVCDPARLEQFDPPMDEPEQEHISETVGIGAIKYADLAHDRTSDYKFNLEKMVALTGNTSTYAQYSYARTASILRRVGVTESEVTERAKEHGIEITHAAERSLAVELLRFEEALNSVYMDYAPNHLVDYVYTVAEVFSRFNTQCHVLNAESKKIQTTRLALVLVTGRVIKQALHLLGINVVQRM
ncbi:MAG: arginine--tRNA ligase [Planctomycetota bacterium]